MLKSLHVKNFRSFADTSLLKLAKLNVFIGANNAGKSSLLSAVELFLRSFHGFGGNGPLAFDEIPSFASFDSVLRRHWSNRESRSHEFVLEYDWGRRKNSNQSFQFHCRGRQNDNTSYVHEALYGIDGRKESIAARSRENASGRLMYDIEFNGKKVDDSRAHFHGLTPHVMGHRVPPAFFNYEDRFFDTEVVRPYRPVPRSFYVLDDPGLSKEDRNLIAFLIDTWSSKESSVTEVRERIVNNLKTLGLVQHIEIRKMGKKTGPKVVEIRVAPGTKRQSVTIADVGFGLSQALPLVAYDARLSDGILVAYQPEVHLHPFAQSRLADLFVASVRRNNQIFVETHSAEIILRLQAHVVSGAIDSSNVRVFCLSNDNGTSEITPVELRADGAPTIPWPSGFLDTSLSLARNLASQRSERRK